jgi:hypothetical protein
MARQSATSRDSAREVTSETHSTAPHVEPAGIAISFDFGKKHGSRLSKFLFVNHGGQQRTNYRWKAMWSTSGFIAERSLASALPASIRLLTHRKLQTEQN